MSMAISGCRLPDSATRSPGRPLVGLELNHEIDVLFDEVIGVSERDLR